MWLSLKDSLAANLTRDKNALNNALGRAAHYGLIELLKGTKRFVPS